MSSAVWAAALLALAAPKGPAKGKVAPDLETFHGWSKDGTWLVYEVTQANELVELYFCATQPGVKPSWPEELEELEREELAGLSCVHFLDPNKAPYQWKTKLVLPAPSSRSHDIEVSSELVLDGETPGFVLLSGDQRQPCEVNGLKETSRLGRTWFHPAGKLVAAIIDGRLKHCVVTLKPQPKKKK